MIVIVGYSDKIYADTSKINNTKYYKSLVKKDEDTGVASIITLIKEAYKSPQKNKEKLSILREFLGEKTLRLSREKTLNPDYYYAYGLASMAYLKSLETRERKQKETELRHTAAYNNFIWYLLTKQDITRCKHSEELEKPFHSQTISITDNLKVYLRQIPPTLMRDIYYILKAVHEEAKNRLPNRKVCEKSDFFQERLSKTGSPIYQTIKDGTLHLHLKDSEEYDESSKQVGYINTQKIVPEYISDKAWKKKRTKVFSKLIKEYFPNIKNP